jgi:hypothetical protein
MLCANINLWTSVCCVEVRPSWAGSSGKIITKHVYSIIFALPASFPDILHSQYTTLFYHLPVNFEGHNLIVPHQRTHTKCKVLLHCASAYVLNSICWLTDWQNDTSCRHIKWLTNAKEIDLGTSLVCTPHSLYQDYRIQYQLPLSCCIHTMHWYGKFLDKSNELYNFKVWMILSLLTDQLSAVYKSGGVRRCERKGSLC